MDKQMRNLTILLPARNEVEGLGIVVDMIPGEELRKLGWNYRLVLVDGYSTDGTVKLAEELGITVYDQRGGVGKGMGLRQAFTHYLESGDDALVMLDPDGTYDPRDMPRLLQQMDDGKFDVVIGSRLRGKIDVGAMGRVNYLGNHILTWSAVALYRRFISDLCTGFWVFRREAIDAMRLNSISFEIEAEMYAACCHNKMRIGEVPIRYHNRIGTAKLGSIHDGVRIFRKLFVRRFFRRPVN
ncbi:MAG: glycosyltransferase family 2 protein [Candidatus Thalassarchaeaceae archaeon]|nr:glycosyltransferase family 2 protein [Candidatus Thalassarchaeaceae archaeon]